MRKESRPERRRRRGNGTHKALPRHRGCRRAPRPTRRRAQGWARPRRAGGVQTPPVNGRPPRTLPPGGRRRSSGRPDAVHGGRPPRRALGSHGHGFGCPPVNTLGPRSPPSRLSAQARKAPGFCVLFFFQTEVNARAHPGSLSRLFLFLEGRRTLHQPMRTVFVYQG
nr:mitochondrial import inner membrane translocase subunit Tim9 isoform X2 [Peromyscus maniculatus bairdii]XP_042116697.1 mitochondrial import inner membrane translocase subunit Tim9 isoform X2 [Peromyscus maniculatus bairdii]